MIGDFTQQLLRDIDRALESGRTSAGAAFSSEQLKPVIEKALASAGLVTREEFDAQQAVLRRTREKLESLEQDVRELEARVTPEQPFDDRR